MLKLASAIAAVSGIAGYSAYNYRQNENKDLSKLVFHSNKHNKIIAASFPICTTKIGAGYCIDYGMWHRGNTTLSDLQFELFVANHARHPYMKYVHMFQTDVPLYKEEKLCYDVEDEPNGITDEERGSYAKDMLGY